VNPLPEVIDALDLTSAWTYAALFLAASLLMIWRFEALLRRGREGTALGTLVMPYCSGLGNLVFVGIVAARQAPPQKVLINCLVNNVTNLTLVLGLPALVWGLALGGVAPKGKKGGRRADGTARALNRLSLLLTLAAVLFFTGVTWTLGRDGWLDRSDGLVLVALFLFWQCFQIFDVMKHNVRERRSFGAAFYFDLCVVLLAAYALYVSVDWLVTWLSTQPSGFLSAKNLGWLSGWLMVLPNALLAFYYAAKGRGDVAYASQVGDGHICIPLCLGLGAMLQPIGVPAFFEMGLTLLGAAAVAHLGCVAFAGGLSRWMGWPLLAAYAWFVGEGLAGGG
jgi:cation:H+ antiporter